MIVGLRSDLQADSTNQIQLENIAAWQQKYPRLAIVSKLFTASSLTSTESVINLHNALDGECNRIFDKHSVRIPSSYRSVLQNFKHHPRDQVLVPWEVLLQEQQPITKIDRPTFLAALKYLHAIGRIVLLKSGKVCTNPTLIPQIAAKFISPEEVQLDLLQKESNQVQILSKEEVGCLLHLDTKHNTRSDFLLVVIVSNLINIVLGLCKNLSL